MSNPIMRLESGAFLDIVREVERITAEDKDTELVYAVIITENPLESDPEERYNMLNVGAPSHYLAQKYCEAAKQEKLETNIAWMEENIEMIRLLCNSSDNDLDVRVKIQEILENM